MAKIRRWLDERARIAARDQSAKPTAARARAERESWMRFLRDALERSGAPWIGLLLHWHSGSPASGWIDLRGRERRSAAGDPQLLLGVEEDVLYEFALQ